MTAGEQRLFDVQESVEDDVVRVALTGELDYGTVGILNSALARIADQRPAAALRIDLRSLEFIDSSGVAALLNAHSQAVGRGARLEIVRGDENVQRPLLTLGTDQILRFVDG